MKVLTLLEIGLGAIALLAGVSNAAPNPLPTPVDLHNRAIPTCMPTGIAESDYRLDFEEFDVPCFWGPCGTFARVNLSTPRGAGLAYQKWNQATKPLLFPNVAAWQVFNCTLESLAGRDGGHACANNSAKALYSPGKSPWDPKIKPSLNTLDFPETYVSGSVKAFHFTPINLPAGTKSAKLELVGYKRDGKKVKHDVDLDIASGKKRFFISGLDSKGFKQIKVLEFWLVVKGKGGYEFAIDDMDLTEDRYPALPASCTPSVTVTVDKGPCTPAPARTTTWTADAQEFTTSTAVPTPYKSLNWNSYIQVLNTSTLQYLWPPTVEVPRSRGGENFYQGWSPLHLSANTYEQRFGVDSLDLVCGFTQWSEPDYGGTNGRPCEVTFVGRRDPFDGDGLPSLVMANFSIPYPDRDATSQKFTHIDLNKLTNSPGKFTRLYSFTMFTKAGNWSYDTMFVVDNLVFNRGTKADEEKCRMPGVKVLNFDDLKVGSEAVKMPEVYKGFKFASGWAVNSNKNYPPNSPGSIAASSKPNFIWSGYKPTPDSWSVTEIDTYVNPKENFLFDFEEATITFDLPEYNSNKTIVEDVSISISVIDACGFGSYYPYSDINRSPYFYWRTVKGFKQLTWKFAEPIRGISKISFYANLNSGDYRRIEMFIDDFKYRVHDEPTPGCSRCGFRGGDFCEVPRLLNR
ncbi:hypothetical protein BDZ91DRAFT_731632 [Kalaharituber pfeilii]|nr:hypothetical protein BDZ91DRAFT_731632 [Kalaharituber pfeilii]